MGLRLYVKEMFFHLQYAFLFPNAAYFTHWAFKLGSLSLWQCLKKNFKRGTVTSQQCNSQLWKHCVVCSLGHKETRCVQFPCMCVIYVYHLMTLMHCCVTTVLQQIKVGCHWQIQQSGPCCICTRSPHSCPVNHSCPINHHYLQSLSSLPTDLLM